MKKMLASDYDRTFYLDEYDIEKNKKSVNSFRKDGNAFVIATGRSYYHFMKMVEKFNLKYDYVIINHGSTIIDNNDNVIYNISIDDSVIPDLKKDLKLNKAIDTFCCSKLETNIPFERLNLTKINVKYKTKKESLQMNEIINKKYSEFVTSYNITSSSIEIISNKTNKSKAIQIVADKLGIDKTNIYTIGDSYTDIQMVKDFNGYCMQDSVKELKEVANREYKSVSSLVYDIMKSK